MGRGRSNHFQISHTTRIVYSSGTTIQLITSEEAFFSQGNASIPADVFAGQKEITKMQVCSLLASRWSQTDSIAFCMAGLFKDVQILQIPFEPSKTQSSRVQTLPSHIVATMETKPYFQYQYIAKLAEQKHWNSQLNIFLPRLLASRKSMFTD